MNKELLKGLVDVVSEPRDYSITFTFTLNSSYIDGSLEIIEIHELDEKTGEWK